MIRRPFKRLLGRLLRRPLTLEERNAKRDQEYIERLRRGGPLP